jgi:hypothetical protein
MKWAIRSPPSSMSRSWKWPVTAEVAGSSPVAPVSKECSRFACAPSLFDASAALGWALYASLLGFFGGEAFEKAPWNGLSLAIGIASSAVVAIDSFVGIDGASPSIDHKLLAGRG